ncbi:MAG: DNA polymerase IV [Parcubacteria group bacterium]|nr:DNA polymerase IV [Parcubacteria group bacterium]
MERIIFHIDMDAFFASIEERENPHFRGKPIVVGADPNGGHGRGVVSTANYQARTYGIKSAMPISEAYRRCPHAIFLPVNGRLYSTVSQNIFQILRATTRVIEPVGIDEAYLDMSHCESFTKAEEEARNIKRAIVRRERITASIGIGPNKLVAKIASDHQKPDGLTVVLPSNTQQFLDPLPVGVLRGIGQKTSARLYSLGVRTVAMLREVPRDRLGMLFGKQGCDMYDRARGIDVRPVKEEDVMKSIGREHTFSEDIRDMETVFSTLEALADTVLRDLEKEKFLGRTLAVIVRYAGFETHTRRTTLSKPFRTRQEISRIARQLILPFLIQPPLKKIRLVGIRISNAS